MSMKCITPKPHFYISKLGYTGVYLFFLLLIQNIDCGYSLESPPRRFLLVPTIYVLSKNKKNIKKFPMNFSIFTARKYLHILYRQFFIMHAHVFVMNFSDISKQNPECYQLLSNLITNNCNCFQSHEQ